MTHEILEKLLKQLGAVRDEAWTEKPWGDGPGCNWYHRVWARGGYMLGYAYNVKDDRINTYADGRFCVSSKKASAGEAAPVVRGLGHDGWVRHHVSPGDYAHVLGLILPKIRFVTASGILCRLIAVPLIDIGSADTTAARLLVELDAGSVQRYMQNAMLYQWARGEVPDEVARDVVLEEMGWQ